jgi:uncharacterized membrane protein
LWNNGLRTNALIGLLLGIFAFWQLSAGIRPGFNFHLLGATLFVLMFGWRIALTMLSLVMLVTWVYRGMPLLTLGINGLLMIFIPVIFSQWVLILSQRYLPKNFFMFVLGNGFLCGGISMMVTIVSVTLTLLLLSPYTWQSIQHNYLIAAPIIMFAEAFTTGAIITAFTVSQPQAVANFSDQDYLVGK